MNFFGLPCLPPELLLLLIIALDLDDLSISPVDAVSFGWGVLHGNGQCEARPQGERWRFIPQTCPRELLRGLEPFPQLSADPSLDGLPAAERHGRPQNLKMGGPQALVGAVFLLVCLETAPEVASTQRKSASSPSGLPGQPLPLHRGPQIQVFVRTRFLSMTLTHLDPGGLGPGSYYFSGSNCSFSCCVGISQGVHFTCLQGSVWKLRFGLQCKLTMPLGPPSARRSPPPEPYPSLFLSGRPALPPFTHSEPWPRTPKAATQPPSTETNLQTAPKLCK